jgi:hypothetical protein
MFGIDVSVRHRPERTNGPKPRGLSTPDIRATSLEAPAIRRMRGTLGLDRQASPVRNLRDAMQGAA